MKYVEGQTLSALLKHGALPLERARQIRHAIVAALDYAHAQRLIHRDVKPGNVMLKPDRRAVLMDSGVAKLRDSNTDLTETGMAGTLSYAASEQITCSIGTDQRANIYALGVMTLQMLPGKLPFESGIGQLVFAHLNQPAPHPVLLCPQFPASTGAAIMQAISKQPAEYQSTAYTLVNQL